MSSIYLSQLTFNVLFLVLFHCIFCVLIFVYLSCTNKDNIYIYIYIYIYTITEAAVEAAATAVAATETAALATEIKLW